MRLTPAPLMRSSAPIHSSRSGFTGFLTRTGMSTPRSESASSCMAKGLAVVRAPIHKMSIPLSRQASTCLGVATSVDTSMPSSSCTRLSQGRPSVPTPSKPPGLVRGFHTPARNILMPFLQSWVAVFITCSSVSAEHGPAITMGRLLSMPGRFRGDKVNSIVFSITVLLNALIYVLIAAPSRLSGQIPVGCVQALRPSFPLWRRAKYGCSGCRCCRR